MKTNNSYKNIEDRLQDFKHIKISIHCHDIAFTTEKYHFHSDWKISNVDMISHSHDACIHKE